ncbi:MAG TPA: hypothetical protein VGM11_08625 [Acidobacteriaceae bacterium]|jgi:hypothetical protein
MPQRTARVLLLALALGLCDQTYWQYSFVDRYQKGYWKTFIDGTGLAPEQYRIGVKLAAWWMVKHFGWGFRHGFVVMDVISTLTALFLLYALLNRRRNVQGASLELNWFSSAGFLALVCFYLSWVGSYFRPETLPTAGLVAVMLWLWSSWSWTHTRGQQAWTIAGLIAASALQAWIRADVPLALNAGMFLAYCLPRGPRRVQYRSWKLVASAACCIVAGATQLYIMHVKYPHASYGSIPIIMVRYDLRQPLTFPPFLCFMVPVVWTFVQYWRTRRDPTAEEADTGLVIGSILYLLLWIVMGKVDELRIYIPFALALSPLTVDLALRRIARPRSVLLRGPA